jgi:hypothetical protein
MEKYSLERARDEAIELRKKAQELKDLENKKGEPTHDDYEKANQIMDNKDENTEQPIELKHSKYREEILSGGKEKVTIDEKEKEMLMPKINLIASRVEQALDLKKDEELEWEISYIPPITEERLEMLKKQAENEAESKAWEFIGSKRKEGEKIFGQDFISDIRKSPEAGIEKFKPMVLKYLMENLSTWAGVQEWDFFLRANVTVTLKNKLSEAGGEPYYANINLFGDEIIQKHKGKMTMEELINDIASKLNKNKE